MFLKTLYKQWLYRRALPNEDSITDKVAREVRKNRKGRDRYVSGKELEKNQFVNMIPIFAPNLRVP